MRIARQFWTLAAGVAMASSMWAQAPHRAPLSQRVVSYAIDAKYDAGAHSLDGFEVLTYRNLTGQPLDRFPFHLYLNAFQPKSTFMRELRWQGGARENRDFEWKDQYDGSNEVTSFEVVGMGDLTSKIHFLSPDDGNPDDRTVFEVQLPHPVAPDQTVQFKIRFHARFPKVLARSGYKRDFMLGGQWFPKVGVWWKSSLPGPDADPAAVKAGWNCHQYHSTTEFFADFGTFDVRLNLPRNFKVGATGVEVGQKSMNDGTITHTFLAEDVHDFAWTAAPDFTVVEDEVQLSAGPVRIRLLLEPGHLRSTARYLATLKGSMKKFDEWYGPYPYPQITVVDPPEGAEGASGMEYPTFITAATMWWAFSGFHELPDVVVEHEFGHQYWYGMVATNEFEDAWLDEGINSYTEVKVMDALFGRATSILDTRVGTLGERELQRSAYMAGSDYDPLARPAWRFLNSASYEENSYGKTASMLLTLEGLIGEDTLRSALRIYFLRFRFRHPTAQDFTSTVNEVAKQDLNWYWRQAVYGTQALDDRVLEAGSDREDWWKKNPPPDREGETSYHSYVVVHRRGNFDLPVILQVKFDNGEILREHWDGKDRWHRFVWDKKAKLVSAEIDPDHLTMLDRNLLNNSYLIQPDTRATHKLISYWVVLEQWLEQIVSWLA